MGTQCLVGNEQEELETCSVQGCALSGITEERWDGRAGREEEVLPSVSMTSQSAWNSTGDG